VQRLLMLPVLVALAIAPHVPSEVQAAPSTSVLVDDFAPQPLQGDQFWFYNRLGGDRGQISGPGSGVVDWGEGVVTATITEGTDTWIGVWTSLNHPIAENVGLDFSAILPSQILPDYQGSVTGVRFRVLDGQGTFQAEVQAPDLSLPWSGSVPLSGGQQDIPFDLPALGEARNLNWLVIGGSGDFVEVDRVELIVEVPALVTQERAFLWSYAMLLSNWDPASGLTRDRANSPAGDFDNVSASGLQAAAAAMAWHLGFISTPVAEEIVTGTATALVDLPTCHGLWPHFVENGQIAPDTEWSSLDSVIAIVALLEAHEALGLETAAIEQVLTDIDWAGLILPDGSMSHGYDHDCAQRLEAGWKDFGTESWLANFGYAAATGEVAEMDHTPPTFNGSGFIDELAWLLVPPPHRDRWGIEWQVYRQQAASSQLAYYEDHPCYEPQGLFGLSAAEVPDPSSVDPSQIYQAFGVGGKIPPNDGTALLGHAVVVPHYAALIASLRPDEASAFWNWIEGQGLFTPLNNVESFMFVDEPACEQVVWNALKGSWNLGLQTLGWGRLLVGDDNPLYAGLSANDMLRPGYTTMTAAVGGVAQLPEIEDRQLEVPESSSLDYSLIVGVVAAVIAGVIALGGAAWYARTRWLR
jgi:hypothetical protein